MNRLWVRLSLLFGVSIVFGVVLVLTSGMILTQSGVLRYLVLSDLHTSGGMIDQLAQYYATHENWNQVEELMRPNNLSFDLPEGFFFFLTDRNERLVFPSEDHMPEDIQDLHRDVLPIVVDSEIRGYLNVVQFPPRSNPRLLQRISTALVTISAVAGVLGVITGALISRTLTAPLSQLAEAARAIGARNFERRVEVRGTREIVVVADSFNEMSAALQEAEMLRRNLMADVAHELRTPLSVMQGNVRAMLDDVYPINKEELTRVYDQTRLLSRLVNDLHELAQAEANQLHLNLQPTDLNLLVERAVSAFMPLAESEGVKLNICLLPNAPLVIADSVRLNQVFSNLISNALRHTPGTGTVSLQVTRDEKWLCLIVEDDGEGISPEHLPHIFERFYRADRSRSRHTGGAGLGLAITKAIVVAHHGEITAQSAGAQRGTTITVKLPLA